MRADQNGMWTCNDDGTFDGAIQAESLQGGGNVSQPDGMSPHERFIHSCAHGDKAPRECHGGVTWTSIICS